MLTLTFDQPVSLLIGSLVSVLLAATGVGRLISLRAVGAAARAAADNLNARIRSWWVMGAIFGGALALGRPAVLALFALISWLALREFLSLTPTRPADHAALLTAFYLLPLLHYVALGLGAWDWFALLMPVAAFALLPLRSALGGDQTGYLARVATLQWAVMLCVYNVSHAPALLWLDGPSVAGRGVGLLVFLIAVAQGSDVLQYCWGKLLGRHRLAPRISPHKTWEGLVGGIASATLLGAALAWLTPFGVPVAAALALLIALLGFAGGLIMSAVKRDAGVKDFGGLIAGHGGVLDRIDSLCFSAPAFFYLVRALAGA